MDMTSNRPYLLSGLYEWICDNYLTPHLLVDATGDDLSIPFEFVEEGKIVLNISPSAVRDLELGSDYVSFKARFSGKSMNVYFPVDAVLAIYSKENGRGMAFEQEESPPTKAHKNQSNEMQGTTASNSKDNKSLKKKKPPHLKIIK